MVFSLASRRVANIRIMRAGAIDDQVPENWWAAFCVARAPYLFILCPEGTMMRTFSQWQDLVGGSIRLQDDTVARDAIAFMCWSDERSGAPTCTWHASAVYHGHPCNCGA